MKSIFEVVLSLWHLPFYGLRWAIVGCAVLFAVIWVVPLPSCARHTKAMIRGIPAPVTTPAIQAKRIESKKRVSPGKPEAAKAEEKAELPKTTSEPQETDDTKEDVAVIFASVIMAISGLITLVSFPVYIFSKDKDRSKKAGGAFKTAFTFLLTTGGGLMAYLGFAA
jgi:hypothetical protein